LNCDFDVTKGERGRRRPDIIFHIRGTHLRNFIVIEVKREMNAEGWEGDMNKIRNFWFGHPLLYRFGACVVIDELNQTFTVRLIERDGEYEPTLITSQSAGLFIHPPEIGPAEARQLRRMVRQIKHLEKHDGGDKLSQILRVWDRTVTGLFQ
jgi:hypothetical protein